MKSAKSNKHPLQIIREAIGDSRSQFAEQIGCTTHTVKRIEQGRMKISDKLARKIYLYTGAHQGELMKGLDGAALDITGLPYSKEFFEQRRPRQPGSAPTFPTDPESLIEWARVVFDAAREDKRLPQVLDSFVDWMESAREEFGLAKTIDRQLRGRAYERTEKRTVGEWRADKDRAQWFGYKDKSSYHPDKVVTIKKQVFVPWCPLARPPKKGQAV
jgi:transcriptional regulator with XRE-family HTH domain